MTQRVWDTPDGTWTQRDILVHSPTERAAVDGFHDVDIEHFCAVVIHPDRGKAITQYKKLANDPNQK